MRIFTVDEANELLLIVRPKLELLRDHYHVLGLLRDGASAAAAASDVGGGMVGGSVYVRSLFEIGRIISEINADEIQIKDPERGLIDFPSIKDGRIVLLCWQLGEREEIEWWHETEAGFAGRQRL
jgi:hypothetical protein